MADHESDSHRVTLRVLCQIQAVALLMVSLGRNHVQWELCRSVWCVPTYNQ